MRHLKVKREGTRNNFVFYAALRYIIYNYNDLWTSPTSLHVAGADSVQYQAVLAPSQMTLSSLTIFGSESELSK